MGEKSLLEVMSIKPSQTYGWVLRKHYAKRIPPISDSFGLYDEKKLIGVCTVGKPASNPLCIGVLGEDYKHLVFELNRLIIDTDRKNALSFFVGKCLKMLPKPLCLVSYADISWDHVGYIYQATNWLYTGLSARRTEKYDPDNPNKHSKTVIEQTDDYKSLPHRERSRKHRYIYFVGNKKQKKEMLSNLKYPVLSYPKGNNKRYDASYNPVQQIEIF